MSANPKAAKPFDEAWCLRFDPFDGDFGGSGDHDGVLSDKIVTARAKKRCNTCLGWTKAGTRVRRRSEIYDGSLMSWSWCNGCCRAMARDDDGESYERRACLGEKRRLKADGWIPVPTSDDGAGAKP